MAKKSGYIFTNKEHPQKAVMSTILGFVSAASVIMAIYFTFLNDGAAQVRYGVAAFLSMLFSLAGFVLGVMSRMEPDKYYFFSYLGLVMNGLVLAGTGFILFAGVHGI